MNKRPLQNREEQPIRVRNDRRRNRLTHELPFIAGHQLFPKKIALQLPPENTHARFTQPFQRVLQHQVANPHVSTHIATEHGNRTWQQSCNAAITLRSCYAMYCYVMSCLTDVLLCDVVFCDVKLCDALLGNVLLCDVLLCGGVLFCGVLLCDVLFCDVLLFDVLLCDM